MRSRKEKNVIGIKYYDYYRELLKWAHRRPMPPKHSAKLQRLRKHFGGRKNGRDGEYFDSGREDLKTAWNAFVKSMSEFQEKHEQWISERPVREGTVFKLTRGLTYILDKGVRTTKEAVEILEQPRLGSGSVKMKHPITGRMMLLLEIQAEV